MAHRTGNDTFELLASAAQTAANTGTTPVSGMGGYAAIVFCLDVTAAATEAGDVLDMFVQTNIGGQWVDVVHFVQLAGNGGAKRYFAKIVAALAQDDFENASALGAGEVRHLMGDTYRLRWTITDATTTGNLSYTMSVKATGIAV